MNAGVKCSKIVAIATPAIDWRLQACFRCLCVLLFCTIFSSDVFAAHPQPQASSADEPLDASEKARLISQFRSAEIFARRMQSPGGQGVPAVSREEEFQVLHMIQVAADDHLAAFRTDPEFQDAVESMLRETLRAGKGNIPINGAIFEIIHYLPDSERLSEVVYMALSRGASPDRLWLDRVYERLSPGDVERIRSGARTAPVGAIGVWELSVLAIDGSAASQSVLETLLAHARAAESQRGPRTIAPSMVRELERLTALRETRRDSSAMLRWGIAGVNSGSSASGLWAFEEVLRAEGRNYEGWRDAWDDLEATIRVTVEQQLAPALTPSTPRARLHEIQSQAIGSLLSPWVEWADRHGVPVSASVRAIIDTYQPYPVPSTGC